MNNEKEINYPMEITFKSIFRNDSNKLENVKSVLTENELKGDITGKESKNGKFISYTITVVFPSEEILNRVCSQISTINGYMSMF